MDPFAVSFNAMVEDPDHFADPRNRWTYCTEHNFLPVLDVSSQPFLDGFAPSTQFCCIATYRRGAWERRALDGSVPRRKSENLKPTAFLYESDSLPLEAQKYNVLPEGLKHVLSATFSGGKSVHVVVPLSDAVAEEIIDRDLDEAKAVYKALWRRVAEQCFASVDCLDHRCASFGRLARLPGATRQPDGNIQQCLFYNRECVPFDLPLLMEEAVAEVEERTREYTANAVLYAIRDQFNGGGHDYDDDLDHLRRSQAVSPDVRKALALQVLDGGDIPSESQLDGVSYIGVAGYLNRWLPALTEEFVTRAKAAHPSNLTRPVGEYLNREPAEDDEDEDADMTDEEVATANQ